MVRLAGVDSGNKYLKAVTAEDSVVFQNIAAEGYSCFATEMTTGTTKDVLKHLDVIITRPDDSIKRYWIGDFAIKQNPNAKYVEERNKLNSEYGIATCLTALALLSSNKDKEKFAIGTGLPVRDHKTNIKESYRHIMGEYKVEFASGPWKGTEKTIEIVAVKTYQQGLGIFLDQVLSDDFDDPKEFPEHPLLNDGMYALLDIGSKTTNFHVFEDGAINPERATSINYGINFVHNALIKKVTQDGETEIPEGRDEQLIKFNEFAGINLEQLREESIETLGNNIKRPLNNEWSDLMPWINMFYIAGGAGQYIFDKLTLGKDSELVERPQLANAYGFLKGIAAAIIDGKVLDQNDQPITPEHETNID